MKNENISIHILLKNSLAPALKLVHNQWPTFSDRDYQERSLWLAARDENQIVGCASFTREESGRVFLEDLVIDKQWRNQGLGRRLVFSGINSYLRSGDQLIALVSTMNRNAIAFYDHIGFKKLVAREVKARSRIGAKTQNKNCMAWGYTKK